MNKKKPACAGLTKVLAISEGLCQNLRDKAILPSPSFLQQALHRLFLASFSDAPANASLDKRAHPRFATCICDPARLALGRQLL